MRMRIAQFTESSGTDRNYAPGRDTAMTIRAIVFDASGTLLNDIHAVWKANSAAYGALGLDSINSIRTESRPNW